MLRSQIHLTTDILNFLNILQNLLHSNSFAGLRQGIAPSGDMIPWNVARQFQDENFPSLSGARIVRIATHPNYQSMGYGSRALQLLQQYYEMKIPNLDDATDPDQAMDAVVDDEDVSLLEETIKPRKNLPPLLLKLHERKPEKLDYMGVSYGLTRPLLKFWKRAGFTPLYVGQVANNLTGEHTSIMVKNLNHGDEEEAECSWLKAFHSDFRRRVVNLLGFEFRSFSARKQNIDTSYGRLLSITLPSSFLGSSFQ